MQYLTSSVVSLLYIVGEGIVGTSYLVYVA